MLQVFIHIQLYLPPLFNVMIQLTHTSLRVRPHWFHFLQVITHHFFPVIHNSEWPVYLQLHFLVNLPQSSNLILKNLIHQRRQVLQLHFFGIQQFVKVNGESFNTFKMVGLGEVFMLLQETFECLFGGMIDVNFGNRVWLKIFWANDLMGMILDWFFEAVGTNGMGALETIREVERRAEPVGTKSTFELIDVENFHIL